MILLTFYFLPLLDIYLKYCQNNKIKEKNKKMLKKMALQK